LYWIDIDGRALHRTDVSNGRDDVTDFDVRPGSIALREDVDHLLVAAEHSLFDLDLTTGALQDLVRLESASSPTRMNDGRCDPAGRFWVGSMDDPGDSGKNAAQLHCIGADLSVTAMEHRVGVSNSLAFDAASNTMYWADTRQGVIWAYDYDVDAGSRSNQRILIDFEGNLPGAPDGACVDAEGCLWVACVYGWSVARISPRGTVDCVLELPVEKPSMPAFGGRGLDTMYVTSISTGGSRPAAPDQPLAGALLAIDVGVSGLPEPAFAG
jgi:sugar lactone lactonase YvrE